MNTNKQSTRKPVLGWMALALGALALAGLVLYLIPRYSSIPEFIYIPGLMLFEFQSLEGWIPGLGVAGLVLGLLGLNVANFRPALAGVVLNSFVLVLYLLVCLLPSALAIGRDTALTLQPGDYDMATYACQADWYYPAYTTTTSGTVVICDSELFKANGLVLPLATVVLSNGESAGPAIWIEKADHWEFMRADYPAYTVQPGDHLRARIGCAQDMEHCNAHVIIRVVSDRSHASEYADLSVNADQPPVEADINLSAMAGEQVRISINIYNADEIWDATQVVILAAHIAAYP